MSDCYLEDCGKVDLQGVMMDHRTECYICGVSPGCWKFWMKLLSVNTRHGLCMITSILSYIWINIQSYILSVCIKVLHVDWEKLDGSEQLSGAVCFETALNKNPWTFKKCRPNWEKLMHSQYLFIYSVLVLISLIWWEVLNREYQVQNGRCSIFFSVLLPHYPFF